MGHAVLHALVVWHGGCCGGCGRGGRCGTALRLPGHDVRMAARERAHGLVCLAPTATAAYAGTGDIDRAVTAANEAFRGPWRKMTGTDRSNILRKLGTYVEYSVFGSDVSVDWSIISDDKELDVRGAHLGPDCWPAAIRMIESGRLPMERICTHQLPLAEFQKGLDLVASGKESIKVSLIP